MSCTVQQPCISIEHPSVRSLMLWWRPFPTVYGFYRPFPTYHPLKSGPAKTGPTGPLATALGDTLCMHNIMHEWCVYVCVFVYNFLATKICIGKSVYMILIGYTQPYISRAPQLMSCNYYMHVYNSTVVGKKTWRNSLSLPRLKSLLSFTSLGHSVRDFPLSSYREGETDRALSI